MMTMWDYIFLNYLVKPAFYVVMIVAIVSWIVNWIYAGIMYLLSLPGIFLNWLCSLPAAFWDWLVQLVTLA